MHARSKSFAICWRILVSIWSASKPLTTTISSGATIWAAVTYFNKEVFGEDKVVRHPYCNYPNYVEGLLGVRKLSNEEAARQAPLSADKGKAQLLRVLNGGLHTLKVHRCGVAGLCSAHTSYYDYLKNTLGVDDPGVLENGQVLRAWTGPATGADVMSISAAAKSCGALGFAACRGLR